MTFQQCLELQRAMEQAAAADGAFPTSFHSMILAECAHQVEVRSPS